MVDRAQQERRLNDLDDIRRVTSSPKVGEHTKIKGKPVHFDRAMLAELLRRREVSTENDGIRSRDYDPTRDSSSGANLATFNDETGEWEILTVATSENTLVEGAALRGLSETEPAQWVTNEHGQKVRVENWRGHDQPDPVGKLAEKALEQLDIMARAARTFEKTLAKILNAGELADKDRKSQGVCGGCKRPVPHVGLSIDVDRLVSGYCDRVAGPAWSGCYRHWLGQGRPDRPAFERWVQDEMLALAEAENEERLADGPGYQVDEIDRLVANGTLPEKRENVA